MSEETVFVEVDGERLGEDDWRWLGDLNVVAIRRGLTVEGKAKVLDDVSHWWRRHHLSVVDTA